MCPDNDVLVMNESDVITPEKPKKKAKEVVVEDVMVNVLFTKNVYCAGKQRKIHDIGEILQSELDKLPEKSYLVRKVK